MFTDFLATRRSVRYILYWVNFNVYGFLATRRSVLYILYTCALQMKRVHSGVADTALRFSFFFLKQYIVQLAELICAQVVAVVAIGM